MEYVKKIFFYSKQKKWKAIFLLGVFVIILSFKTITDRVYIYLGKGYDRQSGELTELVNSVIGVPYYQKPQYKNDSPDIAKLSKEEWGSIPDPFISPDRDLIEGGEKGKWWIPQEFRDASGEGFIAYTHPANSNDIGAVANPGSLVEHMPSIEEARHAKSLEIKPIFYQFRHTKPIYRQLCGHFLTCKSLNISVREELWLKPELADNIIKIAERPCDYIRTIDEIRPKDQIVYNIYPTYMGAIFKSAKYDKKDLELGIKWARDRLDCDNKNLFIFPSISHPSIINRKFVLITISKDGIVSNKNKDDKSLNIIVERKDID